MKKKIALSALAFAIIVPTSFVFANENEQQGAQNTQETQREANKKANEAQREANKKQFEQTREQNKQAFETQRETNKQAFETQKDQKKLEHCKDVEKRVETRINRYENNQKMLENVYGNMTSRLTRLVARLSTLGADTSKLSTDIAKLQTMIDAMKKDQADFIASLSATQSTQTTEVCGQKDAEFAGKIGEARKVSALVKADRKAIRDFFQTTIRADLKEIRAKLAAEKEPTKEEEVEAEKTNPAIIPTTTTPEPTETTIQN